MVVADEQDLLRRQAEFLFDCAIESRLWFGKAEFRGNEEVPAIMERRMAAGDGPQAAIEVRRDAKQIAAARKLLPGRRLSHAQFSPDMYSANT